MCVVFPVFKKFSASKQLLKKLFKFLKIIFIILTIVPLFFNKENFGKNCYFYTTFHYLRGKFAHCTYCVH